MWLRCFNAWHKCIYKCHVKKFYWYCQIFGSGSNTLNSQKFPGHISPRPFSSYGMGTRSVTCRRPLCWQARLVREGLIPLILSIVVYNMKHKEWPTVFYDTLFMLFCGYHLALAWYNNYHTWAVHYLILPACCSDVLWNNLSEQATRLSWSLYCKWG